MRILLRSCSEFIRDYSYIHVAEIYTEILVHTLTCSGDLHENTLTCSGESLSFHILSFVNTLTGDQAEPSQISAAIP